MAAVAAVVAVVAAEMRAEVETHPDGITDKITMARLATTTTITPTSLVPGTAKQLVMAKRNPN